MFGLSIVHYNKVASIYFGSGSLRFGCVNKDTSFVGLMPSSLKLKLNTAQ